MAACGKRLKDAAKNFDRNQKYSIKESVKILQKSASKKFDETVELAINLGINAKKSVKWSEAQPFSRMESAKS